jgi:hypothetical protein
VGQVGLFLCCVTDGSCRAIRFRHQTGCVSDCLCVPLFLLWFFFALLRCVCSNVVVPGCTLTEASFCCKAHINPEALDRAKNLNANSKEQARQSALGPSSPPLKGISRHLCTHSPEQLAVADFRPKKFAVQKAIRV